MRRILIALLAVLAIGSASAQLQVNTLPQAEVVSSPYSDMSLKRSMHNGEMEYYIVGSTTNQFDKPMLLFLGKLEETKTSLNQLLNELYIVGEQYELTDSTGAKFWAYAQNELGTERYAIRQKGYAGTMYLPLRGIRKMLSVIDSYSVFTSKGINVVDTAPVTYVVYPMRAGVSLKYTKAGEVSEYYLQLNTTNQFDGAMLIYLGDRERARTSLSQLLNELYELDKSHTLVDSMGQSFIATCAKTFGAKGYAIFKDGYAGHAYIRLSQISEMLGKI